MKQSIQNFISKYRANKPDVMSLLEYLELCKTDSSAYSTAAERLLIAIGEPDVINTDTDPRLSRIFANRKVKIYPAFAEFYGMEEAIENIVSYLKHSAQGLEEKKQILYLLGPVGGGKSSLAEKLKKLMENSAIYALAIERDGKLEISPINESPLGLFGKADSEDLGIPERYLTERVSPWATKRLTELEGDVTKFKVVKLMPSQAKQIAIAKTEPGDENNQDISALVGKTDIRKIAKYSQDDTDSYSYSGGLCLANQGMLEFVEMFKAPIKVLHPLLTATQEGNYNGTEAISSIPFTGLVIAHSNEAEWTTFKSNKANEAFIDRVYLVKVPYCLRVSEEVKIYEKLISNSALKNAVCAPQTLKIMAQFSILSRLFEPENSNIFSKMSVYDGQNIKDEDPRAHTCQEYRDAVLDAGLDEGFDGISTRFAFKTLSKVFNYDTDEVAANPVHLLYILDRKVTSEQLKTELKERYLACLKHLQTKYSEFIGKEIQTAYLESYSEYGQNIFDRYITFADFWIQDQDFRDPDTGELFDRKALNEDLEEIEKAAGISNPKDFRNEVVNFVLRAKAKNKGKNPSWTSYEKLRSVIEKKMFSKTEELLPVISFTAKSSENDRKKHDDFVKRMVAKGYTDKQVKLLCDWYLRVRKSS
jgi:serine protein kinase